MSMTSALLACLTLDGCASSVSATFGLGPCPGAGGSTVVFSAFASNDSTDLYGLDAEGEFARLSTDGLSSQPESSSDGHSIMFVRNNDIDPFKVANPVQGIWSANVSSGTEELVTMAAGPSSPRWAPSGAAISLTVRDANGRGHLNVAAVGGEPEQITSTPNLADGHVVVVEEPSAWSPDGKHLAFQRIITSPDGSAPGSLLILDLATGAEEELPGECSFVDDLSWSPDGASLLFSDFLPDSDPVLRTRDVLSLDLRTLRTAVLVEAAADPSFIGNDSSRIAYSVDQADDRNSALAEIQVLDRASGKTYFLATIPADPDTRLSTASCVVVHGRD